MTGPFQTIISDDVVELATVNTLRTWVSTYLSEVERQRDLDPGFYTRPPQGSITTRSDFDKWPEEQLPAIIVVAPGIPDDPLKQGGHGKYRASYDIGVVCVVSSNTREDTRHYAQRLGAAIRAALVQHQSLDMQIDGNVRGVTWLGESSGELESPDERTIWANRQLFSIEVDDVLTQRAGPIAPEPDPSADPPPAVPTVADASVQLQPEPIL